MEFVPLLAAIALVKKLVDFAKYARVGDVNATVSQVVTWAAGVGVTFLLAGTDFASGIDIGDVALSQLNTSSLILVGLSFGSTASVAYDYLQARDNTGSTAMPTLVTGEQPPPPPPPMTTVNFVEGAVAAKPAAKATTRRARGSSGSAALIALSGVLVFAIVMLVVFALIPNANCP